MVTVYSEGVCGRGGDDSAAWHGVVGEYSTSFREEANGLHTTKGSIEGAEAAGGTAITAAATTPGSTSPWKRRRGRRNKGNTSTSDEPGAGVGKGTSKDKDT